MTQERSKADVLKWNTDVVFGMADEYNYEAKQYTTTHLSLIHPIKGRLDYWPTTGRAAWISGIKNRNPFKIDDIEAYIMEHFNPNKAIKIDPIADLTKRVVDLEWRLRKLESLYFSNKINENVI